MGYNLTSLTENTAGNPLKSNQPGVQERTLTSSFKNTSGFPKRKNSPKHGDTGDDELSGDGGHDMLFGDDGNDTLLGNGGHDILFGDDGNDYLSGGDGDDHLSGGVGNDRLYGDDDNDMLFGSEGDDYLSGGAGNDILWGSEGEDTMEGGEGSDTYFFCRGDGNDTIISRGNQAGDADTVKLAKDIAAADIALQRNNQDLVITIVGTSDSLRIRDYYVQGSNTIKYLMTHDRKEISLTSVNLLIDTMAAFNSSSHTASHVNQYLPAAPVFLASPDSFITRE